MDLSSILLLSIILAMTAGQTLFTSFIQQLLLHPRPRPHYYSSSHVNQSSVGLIFRASPGPPACSPQEVLAQCSQWHSTEVLMTQRAGYPGDTNAYNVVFPGGQADPGETDLQACQRELQEEIGLDVGTECVYLGGLPGNFYYQNKRSRRVMVTCHVWVVRADSSFQPRLNPDQLSACKWVPFEQLFQPANLTQYQQKQLAILRRIGWLPFADNVQRNLMNVGFPAMQVGLGRQVWGLTLWIVGYVLQLTRAGLVRSTHLEQEQTAAIQRIDGIMGRISDMELRFKPDYLLKHPIRLMVRVWHYYNRVLPFTYPKSTVQQLNTPTNLLVLLLVLLVVVIVCI